MATDEVKRKPRHHVPPKAVEVDDKLQKTMMRKYEEHLGESQRYMQRDMDTGQLILAEMRSIKEILKAIERKL